MKTEKYFTLSMLLDIYGSLLTQKQRDALDMSLNEDLSLSEIAENTGVSRQAAQDAIKKAEQRLEELESALGVYRLRQSVNSELEQLSSEVQNGKDTQTIEATIEKIKKILWED